MSRTLTVTDARAVAVLINGVEGNAKITILPSLDRKSRIAGTIRYLTPCSGAAAMAPSHMDVRDTYVRITTVQGFEAWISFADLMQSYLNEQVVLGVAQPE